MLYHPSIFTQHLQGLWVQRLDRFVEHRGSRFFLLSKGFTASFYFLCISSSKRRFFPSPALVKKAFLTFSLSLSSEGPQGERWCIPFWLQLNVSGLACQLPAEVIWLPCACTQSSGRELGNGWVWKEASSHIPFSMLWPHHPRSTWGGAWQACGAMFYTFGPRGGLLSLSYQVSCASRGA